MIKCYPFTKTVQASAMKACFRIAERCLSSTKTVQASAMRTCFRIAECSLSSTKTVQASAMKACFRIAERRLSSTKIQNLAPPLQVFREENIREPSCSCSLKRKTSVSLHCQCSGNTLRSCYQMWIFGIYLNSAALFLVRYFYILK